MRNYPFLLVVLLLLLFNCDNNYNEQPKHPSEYTWTIDTLELSVISTRFRPTDILYLNENDIYIFGESGHYNPVFWHYNGSKWQDTIVITNASAIVAATNISGDIYGVGDTRWYLPEGVICQGSIDKFNGNSWQQIFYAHIEGQRGSEFRDIWADSEDNIWVGGYLGLLYHYNGQEWVNYCFPDTVNIYHFSGNDSTGLYAIGYYLGNNQANGYLLKWSGENWIMENRFSMAYADYLFRPFGHLDLYVTGDNIYTCGDGVFCKQSGDSTWQKLWQFSDYKFRDVSGSGAGNIYFVGDGGNAIFWDGVSPSCLDSIYYPEITYKKVWTDGNQVIITGFSDNISYVMWGK
jgi:hypothetical protein